MRSHASLPPPPADAHTALTDPAALRTWLAKHASEEGFWGRWTPQGDALLELGRMRELGDAWSPIVRELPE